MRFDGVTEQKARAKFRAIAALVARGFADSGLLFRGFQLAFNRVMIARQNDDAGGSFRNGRVKIVGRGAHHQTAEAQHGIIRREAASVFDTFAERRADGHAQGARRIHRAGDGEHFMRERLAVVRTCDVHKRFDVVDDRAKSYSSPAG